MSNFIINTITGTVVAATATAGLAVAGISTRGLKTEKATTEAAKEAINTISTVLAPPIRTATLTSKCIEMIETSISVTLTLLSTIVHAKYGIILTQSLASLAALLARVEVENVLVEGTLEGAGAAFRATIATAVQLEGMFIRGITPMLLTLLFALGTLGAKLLTPLTNIKRTAPEIGGLVMARGLTFKAVEMMGGSLRAAEAAGGLIFAAAGGTAAAAVIAKVNQEGARRGGDENVGTLACLAALLLWTLAYQALMSNDTSAADLLSAWAIISPLSGLMAAAMCAALPRQHANQN